MSDTSQESFRVFGLGTIVVDHQVIMTSLPEADTKGEVIEDRYQVGGPVPTALALLRRFGCETGFQGKWSDDPPGKTIDEDLQGKSIAFDARRCSTGSRTGFAHVWIEQKTGRRSIAAYRGSHPVGQHELQPGQLDGFHALHMDGWSTSAAIALAEDMKKRGGLVSLDLGSPKAQLDQLLAHVDVMTCPNRMVHRLFATDNLEEGARKLMEMGPTEVTLTCGEHGSIHFSKDGRVEHPGFEVNAIDTNGAGDTFAGAMLFAKLSGGSAEQKLQFACAAAALKCTQLGNREALPSLEAIESFLQFRAGER
jgi:sugar/nucleoside kinase (ribokinase family)